MEQHEVEEVSFLPGEAILNKKAVYEPSKTQRFRQVVCSKGLATCIILGMGTTMVVIALIVAFARPIPFSDCASHNDSLSLASSTADTEPSNSKHTPNFLATNGETFPWKEMLLPKDIIPLSYDVFLHPNISKSNFQGTVRMTLKVVNPTDFIVFHTKELNLSDVHVTNSKSSDKDIETLKKYGCHVLQKNDKSENKPGSASTPEKMVFLKGKTIGIKKQLEYVENQQYYIQMEELLQQDVVIYVSLKFRGSLADLEKMVGFYKSSYTVNGEERYMVSTQFEASNARSAFPCMDEPALKATFTLSIVRDPNLITLFNTKLLKTESYEGNLKLDVYEPTVCMSTYLVAYVVTDFKSLTKKTKDGVMVRVFASEDKIYMGQFALDAAVTIIEKYNDFFGIAYPLDKQDLIAIPNFSAGAMENWGLITYRETAILYDSKKSTVSTKKWVALVIAHELAHQWFGNLVTMKWWDDLWLNEGFASYVENIGAQTVDPSFHMEEDMVGMSQGVFRQDSLSSSHPIEKKVSGPADIEAAFNAITYKKGSALIRMLRGALGSEDFHRGLNYYLQSHSYSNADSKQLWDSLQMKSHSGLNVSKVMNTWTKQMGYPVITVTRDKNKVSLKQERFLLSGNSSGNEKYSWYVPFKYKLSDNTSKVSLVWMERGEGSIELPASSSIRWIKGNADTEGFYRVAYDTAGWNAITKQLNDDHTAFSALDRIGLMDDAFSLAHAGRFAYSGVLDLCKYLVKEKDFFVWKTAERNLQGLLYRLYIHEAYDDLKAFILHLAKPLIDSVGWTNEGSYTERELRSLMLTLAVILDYQPTVDEARKWFQKWIDDPTVSLNPNLHYLIYTAGIKHGTKEEWDIAYQRFQTALVPSIKDDLMYALTSSRDARVLQIYLERSLDTNHVKSQSTTAIIESVAENPTGFLYAWRFIQRNWDTIFDRYGYTSFTLTGLLKVVLGDFSTQFDLDEITAFFKDKDLGVAKNALQQGKETIEDSIAWKKEHLDTISSWLKKFTADSSKTG